MPGCHRTLAHHPQVMLMPRFIARRSSGPGSLLEELGCCMSCPFLGFRSPLSSACRCWSIPGCLGASWVMGPLHALPGKTDPLAPTAQPHVAPALAHAAKVASSQVSPSPTQPPHGPASMALCRRTKENLSGLLRVPGAG